MKIACLGWGSLVWRKTEYPNISDREWNKDGPILPIEFSRISDTKLVTLVIDPDADLVQVLWYLRESDDLSSEVELLRKREGTPNIKNISSVCLNQSDLNPIQIVVEEWLKDNNLDAAIWTGLSCKNKNKEQIRPSLDEIIQHISNLDSDLKEKAKEYFLKTPQQINTKYRKAVCNYFGWL